MTTTIYTRFTEFYKQNLINSLNLVPAVIYTLPTIILAKLIHILSDLGGGGGGGCISLPKSAAYAGEGNVSV